MSCLWGGWLIEGSRPHSGGKRPRPLSAPSGSGLVTGPRRADVILLASVLLTRIGDAT